MKQTIEIEVPEGKKAVWKDNKIVFEDIKLQLPKTWEEFCIQNPIKEEEKCINACSEICNIITSTQKRNSKYDKNVLPSKEVANQYLILMQLHQLRDCYRQGWTPDWENSNSSKYCIVHTNGNYTIMTFYAAVKFLSFQSREIAEEFLNNFKDLIEQAGDLI